MHKSQKNKGMFRLFTCLSGAVLLAVAACGQATPNAALATLNAKGVYYNSTSGLMPLSFTILWPYQHGQVKSFLSVGHTTWDAELAGKHSQFQVADQRPTFYVRGLPSSIDPQLVRLGNKRDYRTVRMQNAGLFEPRSPFMAAATVDAEITPVSKTVVAVRPVANLAPGEYMIAAAGSPDLRSLLLGFDFRVVMK